MQQLPSMRRAIFYGIISAALNAVFCWHGSVELRSLLRGGLDSDGLWILSVDPLSDCTWRRLWTDRHPCWLSAWLVGSRVSGTSETLFRGGWLIRFPILVMVPIACLGLWPLVTFVRRGFTLWCTVGIRFIETLNRERQKEREGERAHLWERQSEHEREREGETERILYQLSLHYNKQFLTLMFSTCLSVLCWFLQCKWSVSVVIWEHSGRCSEVLVVVILVCRPSRCIVAWVVFV